MKKKQTQNRMRWDGKAYGGTLGYQIFIWAIRYLPLFFAYFLLFWVCLYFYLFRRKSTQSSKEFYALYTSWYKKRPRKFFAFWRVYRLGQVLLDRLLVFLPPGKKFLLLQEGTENLLEIQKSGGILLSAHLGNWEVGLSVLKKQHKVPVSVAMFSVEGDFLQNLLFQNTGDDLCILPLSREDHQKNIFLIKEHLEKKRLIAMHGDRFLEDARSVECPFMGKIARFPVGPYVLAASLQKPLCFVIVVKIATSTYRLFCSPLRLYSWNRSIDKQEQMQKWVQEYVHFLESQVALYPEQWFNFYDFWETKTYESR